MNGKGKQFVAHGRRVVMAFPGGAGYGDASERDLSAIKRDLARGYISEQSAADDYGLSAADIAIVQAAIAKGEDL
jgi:N-methylhydantoinase B